MSNNRAEDRMRAPLLMLLAVLAALWLPSPGGALAEIIGDARVGFTAERILIIDGHNYVGKMWHMPGEQRHEQDLPAIRPIFILRSDSAFGDIVLPQLHTVVEFALPKEFSLLAGPGLLRKAIGEESVNGIATTKYAVEEDSPAGDATGSLWLSRDGIPMKCDGKFVAKNGKISTIYWELRHLTIGRQDAALFEVPRGYAKLPPEAAAPLLGIRLARPTSH
jgi:hypothetical protein